MSKEFYHISVPCRNVKFQYARETVQQVIQDWCKQENIKITYIGGAESRNYNGATLAFVLYNKGDALTFKLRWL